MTKRKKRVRCTSEPAALVRCDCGNEMVVSHADLLSGRVTCWGRCGDRIPGHRCGEPEQLTEAERKVWDVWNLLSDDDLSPVKRIARALGMTRADVALIVYRPEKFGRWEDDQEPGL